MLKGTVLHKGTGFKYNVYGLDSVSALNLRISSQKFDAICFMSNNEAVELGGELWERGLKIAVAKITVETEGHISEETGKMVKSPINQELFCQLGATLRYFKAHCTTKNIDGFTGLKLASGEFEPEEYTTYTIPGADDKVLAKVKLRLGSIFELHGDTPLFSIDLVDDVMLDNEVYPTFKNGVQKGFANTEEYLGFEVPKQTVMQINSLGGMYTTLDEVIQAHPEKEFSWLREMDYKIVTDDILQEVCDYIYNYDSKVYFDTETTGLNINFKSRVGQADQCVGIILSVVDGESFFFPMQMKAIKNLCGGDHFYFMEHYMRRILEGKELVAHNMAFDWKVAYIYDINANIVDDTLALYRLTIGAERPDMSVGLKELTSMFLHRDAIELDDIIVDGDWGENDIKFWDLSGELVKYYACADTDDTRGIYQYAVQNDLLTEYNAHKTYEIEIAFSLAVAYQEFYGHLFDVNKTELLRKEIMSNIDRLYNQMCEIIGHEFNPNSSPQLLKILYKELGIPEQISRKTGRATTDKETLQKLSEITDIEGNTKYPFVKMLLEYRVNEGVRKIIDKFPEIATQDGYLFPGVKQYGTTTGRVSIKEPNYQSYNNPVKKEIIPRPGYYMFDTDYSSVEYRVLGNMSGNTMIKDSFYDPDFDYHTYQAARMYGVPYSSVTGKLRKAAKGINFGLPYGMGDESLGVRIFGEKSDENTRKASALRKSYFKGQEDIEVFFQNARDSGVANGYTETYFGRRRYYNRARFSTSSIRRQAGNHVIQGCLGGDTLIQTDMFGVVKIKDVCDMSLGVWDGDKWSHGDILYSGKKQKCIVHFSGGQSIVCSPIHKFLVRSNKGNERFVMCRDLHGTDTYKNAHRVVFNELYEPSVYKYKSDRNKYVTYNTNANNVQLEDIGDSFKIGVMLGRLSADGSVVYREDGGSYIQHFVAEHEYDILPELRECLNGLNYVEVGKCLREERNQKITTLSVYSKSLVSEILDLDIRHKIHEELFKDTELLRGFLRGIFDGDEGISGKTITLVLGTQDDFEPLCKDIQKALLFFGIRSRYRYYAGEDGRHVVQIKTNDNWRFLELIGFLSEDKQEKGESLYCIEDEHVYGRCMLVESVEITDEYIDMYDVCNTDGGYFVADGLITHNTAADVYKLAVGRVFKRICKEGWLGKVLLTGFIHDELLGEVSVDIDPMKWLKVLREEFEVKIADAQGNPWCPLYMGFGWGRNWYEAKSTEIPIKLQWEFVEKYGDTGYPKWHGNVADFCDSVPELLRVFEIEDCTKQLLSEEAQGKEIKPALNSAILGVLKEDSIHYKDVLNDETLRSVYHIQGTITDAEGNTITDVPKTSDTQEAIDYFCMLHNVDRSKVNVLSIEEVDLSSQGGSIDMSDSSSDYEEDDEEALRKQREQLINDRIQTLGMYVDYDNHIITGLVMPSQWMGILKQHVVPKGTSDLNCELMLIDFANQKKYTTIFEVPTKEISAIQNIYLMYLKQ